MIEKVLIGEYVVPSNRRGYCICGCTCGLEMKENLLRAEGAADWVYAG